MSFTSQPGKAKKKKRDSTVIVLERTKSFLETGKYVIDHINFCPRLEGRDKQHSLTDEGY